MLRSLNPNRKKKDQAPLHCLYYDAEIPILFPIGISVAEPEPKPQKKDQAPLHCLCYDAELPILFPIGISVAEPEPEPQKKRPGSASLPVL